MGIYDRDYVRQDRRSSFGPLGGRSVCVTLIIINVVIFLLQVFTMPRAPFGGGYGPVTEWLWLDADKVLDGQVWRLVTYAFLHDPTAILHILFNMLFLYWFGRGDEEIYGPREFLAFYLMAAVLAGVGTLVATKTGLMDNVPSLGASGAVTAVLVLFACHYPNYTILLFFILPIPVWLLVVINIVSDLTGLLGGVDGIGFIAHLTGAGFGFVYYRYQLRVLKWIPSFSSQSRHSKPRRHPRLRVFQESASNESSAARPPSVLGSADVSDADLEAKLDAVLAKMARHGRESLNAEEQAILLRASEVYKNRRSD